MCRPSPARRLLDHHSRPVSATGAGRASPVVHAATLTPDEVARLAEQHGLDLPIATGVRAVLHGEVTPVEGLQALKRVAQPDDIAPVVAFLDDDDELLPGFLAPTPSAMLAMISISERVPAWRLGPPSLMRM